ncbi:TPA: MAE_28990/MAE_18760 family HEPN-like nuclease [Yersinia enterocolitica]|nr:hypothetical protein [Yersinia enterocolitica]HDL6899020.1 hypothetical protein [Yersinia enterocolitica]HDL7091027.1 hypothetical protein [Yersinia enterocolitica]HDZ9833359.1 hypothetical protein [Yersinia enterocolitica]HEC1639549.1 hypothetical protein [Yersinia enterocolitica]
MTLEEFLIETETELKSREDEIRKLNNLISSLDEGAAINELRRATICMLYAHIEGFVKFTFGLYIEAVNKMNLRCHQVKPVLAAAVFYKDFKQLINPDHKSRFFNKTLPDDSHIHRIFRHEEFFEKIEVFYSEKIFIEDGYINTESNVGREIIERLLYQVGLPHKSLNDVIGPLSKLKNKRNDISHGIDRSTIREEDYQSYYLCALEIMKKISRVLFNAFREKAFLKKLKQ